MSIRSLCLAILVFLELTTVAYARCRIFRRRFGKGPIPACHAKQPTEELIALRWRFQLDKPFYQIVTTETKQDMTIMQMKVSQSQKQTFYFRWTPIGRDENGNWIIKQKIIGVKMDLDIGGTKVGIDPAKDKGANQPLSNFLKAVVNTEVTFTIDRNMKVRKIECRDVFLKKLADSNQNNELLLKRFFSNEALKQMTDTAFGMIPVKPVKEGDVWETTGALDMGPIGKYETTNRLVYKGPDKNEKHLQEIEVESTLRYAMPDPNGATGLPFKILQVDLESKNAKGKILFDSRKGRLDSATNTVNLTGKILVEIGGMPNSVDLDQTQTTTAKTTDDNPINK